MDPRVLTTTKPSRPGITCWFKVLTKTQILTTLTSLQDSVAGKNSETVQLEPVDTPKAGVWVGPEKLTALRQQN